MIFMPNLKYLPELMNIYVAEENWIISEWQVLVYLGIEIHHFKKLSIAIKK